MSVELPGPVPSAVTEPRRVVVRAERAWSLPDLREAWHYRELFWVLAMRDVKVRYKQTVLGIAWAILQPFTTMVVFSVISRLGKLSTDGAQPEVFYYSGMLPWLLFANSFTNAGNSLVGSQHLVTKVYFPRLVIPLASMVSALLDFAISFAMLLAIMAFYRMAPAPEIVALPLFVALGFATALAFGLWLAALNVQFRDVRYAAPFLTQLWFFCTPVLYSSSSVGASWKRTLFALNPMAAVVDGFRWCVLGRPTPAPTLALSTLVVGLVFVSGLYYFRRVERTLADRM
jgi:homopolymeric O-antigen transport system permease protein